MKRIFLLLVVIITMLLMSLMAEQAKVKTWCNVRVKPDPKATVNTNAQLKPGDVVDIFSTHGDYYEVEITGGDKDIGKTGWIWVGRMDLNEAKTEAIITKKGITMRTLPNKKGDVVCGVNGGASVKILSCKITWYGLAKDKWVYKSGLELIAAKQK